MKKIFTLLIALMCSAAFAQNTKSGTITGTSCFGVDTTNAGTVGISVQNSGTAWSGTIQPSASIGGDPAANISVTPAGSTTAQATITVNGVYYAAVSGSTYVQVCGNTVTNTAAIKMFPAQYSKNFGGGTGLAGAAVSGHAVAICVGSSSTLCDAGPDPVPAYLYKSSNPSNTFADTQVINDASVTSGQPTVTCSNNDCNFVAATDNGKACYGMTPAGNGTPILPEGTLTVTGAQTATCSGGNATANQTANMYFVWGHYDDAALTAAENASSSLCRSILLPTGVMLIKTAHFNHAAATCTGNTLTNGTGSAGSVFGQSANTTYLVPSPSFSFAGCTGGISGKSCLFGGSKFQLVYHLQVDGFFAGVSAATINLIELTGNTDDTIFGFWCTTQNTCTNATGVAFNLTEIKASNGGSQSIGNFACVILPGIAGVITENWPCQNTSFSNVAFGLLVQGSGASVLSMGNFNSSSSAGAGVFVQSGGHFYSKGDSCGAANGGQFVNIQSGGEGHIYGFLCSIPANAQQITVIGNLWIDGSTISGAGVPIAISSGGNLNISNTTFTSSGNWANIATGGKIFDRGGNTFTGGVAGTCGATCLFDSYSVNQTVCASGNFGFTSGWGTTAVTGTPTGNSQFCQFSIQTTVTGTAGPVLTYTFPQSFVAYGKTPNCVATQVGGTFGTISNPSHSTTTTADTITFTGTPTATQTYTFLEECR